MDATVVLCTYNRAASLRRTLLFIAQQRVSCGVNWETIVVDNNSADSTRSVVAESETTFPGCLRYAFEPVQGLSYARNRGIREARGHIVAFTDDDTEPAQDWLDTCVRAFEEWPADGVGGRIVALWPGPLPRWLKQNPRLVGVLAIMEHDTRADLTYPVCGVPQVWGANMAFRREVFSAVGTFDTRRGRNGAKLSAGEEVDLINRALLAGKRIVYDPRLVVGHRIESTRLRKGYFRRRYLDNAEGEIEAAPFADGVRWWGVPRWQYRVLIEMLARYFASLALLRRDRFLGELRVFEELGRVRGYRRTRDGQRCPKNSGNTVNRMSGGSPFL